MRAKRAHTNTFAHIHAAFLHHHATLAQHSPIFEWIVQTNTLATSHSVVHTSTHLYMYRWFNTTTHGHLHTTHTHTHTHTHKLQVAALFTNPIDVVKIRLQIQGEGGAIAGGKRGLFGMFG